MFAAAAQFMSPTQCAQFSAMAKEIMLPPSVETLDLATVVSAIARQRTARIAKLALFIFSTAYTLVVATLAEATVISTIVALPVLTVSLLFWSLFFRIHSLDDAYLGNADDQIRQNLAKKHLESLLFEIPLEKIATSQQLYSAIAPVNALLGVDIFTMDTLKHLAAIHLSAADHTTLFAAAQAQEIPLKMDFQAERFERGLFGSPSFRRTASVRWNGQKDSDLVVSLQTMAEPAQPLVGV